MINVFAAFYRLEEEMQDLRQQHGATVSTLEQERKDLIAAHLLKLESLEKDKYEEVDRLKELHRYLLNLVDTKY